MRTSRRALAEDADSTVAILYRINSQSRAIEDALMREGVAYKIVGSVRFYERKEIKDALAYLKLIVNPFDDVSLRRVINVPTRGIGRGVMDGLDQLGPPAELPPLLAAGLEPVVSSNALWVRLQRAISERALAPRALQSLAAFRDLIVALTEVATREPVSITVGKMLDQSGYLHDLREDRSEEAAGRIENLMELVSAAKEYEARDPEPSLGGFVDQLSLLSETDEEAGARIGARVDDDHARRQGPGVPRRRHCRTRGRPVPALARVRGRRRARGRAAAVLRRDDPRAAAAGADRSRTTAHVWRVQGHQPVAFPR